MLIGLNGVSLYFKDKLILKDVSLTVTKGDRIGLVGANGAGKSTLLKLITGELTPDDGEIYRLKSASVGYLKQNGGIDSPRTVFAEMMQVFQKSTNALQRMAEIEKELGI